MTKTPGEQEWVMETYLRQGMQLLVRMGLGCRTMIAHVDRTKDHYGNSVVIDPGVA